MEENLQMLATAETWDNGKPIRETTAADLPLAIDHFRYFAGCIRAQEGAIGWRGDNPAKVQMIWDGENSVTQ
jgi:aldehyde dehydrogenase